MEQVHLQPFNWFQSQKKQNKKIANPTANAVNTFWIKKLTIKPVRKFKKNKKNKQSNQSNKTIKTYQNIIEC